MSIPRLLWNEIAAGRPLHAARVLLSAARRRDSTSLHSHDFHEIFYVTAGRGLHLINGRTSILQAGDLVLVRPSDVHCLQPGDGAELHFINIAFSSAIWREYGQLLEMSAILQSWENDADPPSSLLGAEQRTACRSLFDETLRAYTLVPNRLVLCRFWNGVLPLLPTAVSPTPLPDWLHKACDAMSDAEQLQIGLPRFLELCGVSAAHTARTLKAHCGQTPTQWINAQRLKHAAYLLSSTDHSVLRVSLDCGFENLSYFHRLFRARYGEAPRCYRQSTRRAIAPSPAPKEL